MQLITLNLWGGKIFEPLITFIKNQAVNTDIFCFQEMLFSVDPAVTPIHQARLNIFSEIEKSLPDFQAVIYLAPDEALHFQDEPLEKKIPPGQAIFVRKGLHIRNHGGFRCYNKNIPDRVYLGGKITGSCQWIDLEIGNKETLTILNLHGLWQKDTKKADTQERVTQSIIINDFLQSKNGKKFSAEILIYNQ